MHVFVSSLSVAEFGLVGQTMHKVDEHVAIQDIDDLTKIYATFIENCQLSSDN